MGYWEAAKAWLGSYFWTPVTEWLSAYIWAPITGICAFLLAYIKAVGASIAVLFSAMAVHMVGFGDFVLGLLQHGAWPGAIILLAWWYGKDLVAAVVRLLDRIKRAKGRGYELELEAEVKDVEKQARIVEAKISTRRPKSRSFYAEAVRELSDLQGDEGFSAKFWTRHREVVIGCLMKSLQQMGLDAEEAAAKIDLEKEDFKSWLESLDERMQVYSVQLMHSTLAGAASTAKLIEHSKEIDNGVAVGRTHKLASMIVGNTYYAILSTPMEFDALIGRGGSESPLRPVESSE